jgi:thiol-disulfide isomerase/thioredoxin
MNDQKEATGFVINGKITGAMDSLSVIIRNEHFKDSTILNYGEFSFSGKTDTPRKIILKIENASAAKVFWLENSKINIEGDFNDLEFAKVTGGQNQKVLNIRDSLKNPLLKAMKNIISQVENKKMADIQKDSIMAKHRVLSKNIEDVEKQFVKDYPNTLEGIILLGVKRANWNRDTVSTIFATMNDEIQNTEYGILISEYLKSSKNPQIGDKYIDFSLKNTEDKTVILSENLGNYTLIDFWASWCIPCRQENPNLIELYNKYNKKGLQIIGASMDREKSDWLKAVKDDKLPWPNVIDLADLQSNNIFLLYDVRFVPDNLLLDKDGIIIARNLRGEELKKKLQLLYEL